MAWYRCGGTPSSVLSLPTPSETSGAIARFNTDLTENLLSAVAEFSASQASGTPTPSTPIPIVGVDKVAIARTGKNLIIAPTLQATADSLCLDLGQDFTFPSVVFSFLATNSSVVNTSAALVDLREDNGTHHYQTLNSFKDANNNSFATSNNNGVFSVKFTNIKFRYVYISYVTNSRSQFTGDTLSNWQLEIGADVTAYEAPTASTTAIINLGGTYYGGEVDAVTGKITLTSKGQKIKDMTFSYNSTLSLFICTTESGVIVIPPSNNQVLEGLMSECYLPQKASGLPDKCVGVNTAGNVLIADTDYTDVTAWKAAVGENLIIIPLATPIVVYASNTAEIPTIVGDNQVFADSGNVAVKFFETVGHKI